MFEKYQVPAYYLTRKPVMSAYVLKGPDAVS
jgi:actin-related protein